MSKKMKVNLGDLKIKSFVTSLEEKKLIGIKGGGEPTEVGSNCPTWGPCETLKTDCSCQCTVGCTDGCTEFTCFPC